ncbi:unnamed protein product [Cuscuta epithymum]|uniref:Retrovirus-related Pol polyprotein from transposon TNT 1-94-like beta-barrel domain-containing protein n=1 Tax=Cuscuta epithymum TaxID=186058 RepID=A0AAV0DBT8_9ASTE|nr:unnamed protein product [Cuscuta epithymum]
MQGPDQRTFSGQRRYSRRPFKPRCHICKNDGHFGGDCPERFVCSSSPSQAHLAEAFNVVSLKSADSYIDSGASSHMTATPSTLDQAVPYTGKDKVSVSNGATLPISSIGHSFIYPNLVLNDVLVVPQITKNLLSIS